MALLLVGPLLLLLIVDAISACREVNLVVVVRAAKTTAVASSATACVGQHLLLVGMVVASATAIWTDLLQRVVV